jgi:hypothetical protein
MQKKIRLTPNAVERIPVTDNEALAMLHLKFPTEKQYDVASELYKMIRKGRSIVDSYKRILTKKSEIIKTTERK